MLIDHDGPLAPLYHLGTGRNYTMRETLDTIAALVPGTRLRWTDDPGEANVFVAADNRRAPLGFGLARADFGFEPTFALRDGLRDYLEFLEITEREAARGAR
jgi:nucleoside-diphosphate-sugar epimerase